jgi:DNA-directed RNA polymerase specialized sigma subunit
MNRNLRLEGLTEAYYEVQDLIRSTVWNYIRINGVSPKHFPELEGQANLIFVEAYDNYNPDSRCKFSTYLVSSIVRGLIDFKRKKRYQSVIHQVLCVINSKSVAGRKLKNTERSKLNHRHNRILMMDRVLKPASEWYSRLEHLMNALDDDSRSVLILITDRPPELEHLEDVANKEKVLKEFLSERMGWSHEKIKRAFRHMRSVIE